MKYRSAYIILLFLLILFGGKVHASWFIDQERFQASVHGAISCVDCHGNIETGTHPDSTEVNKRLSDFFSADQCSDCHESIEDYVEAGSHGGIPVNEPADVENCMECHDPHYEADGESVATPEKNHNSVSMNDGDEACMSCHRLNSSDQPDARRKTGQFCLYCHDGEKNKERPGSAPLIDGSVYEKGAHKTISCLACHPDSAEFGHSNRATADCMRCHSHHDESIIHDAHINVSCEACHLGGVAPVRNDLTHRIHYQKEKTGGLSTDIHQMKADEGTSCSRCHYKGNTVGAAAMVLPAKSLICMPCHTAVVTLNDPVSKTAIAVFLLGIGLLLFTVSSGGNESSANASRIQKLTALFRRALFLLFSRKLIVLGKSLLTDSLMHSRLMSESPSRWVIHGMIFYPFVIRCAWGLVALVLSVWVPDWPLTRMVLNKNHPLTAFLFEITGILVLVGVALAVLLSSKRISVQFKDMPGHDWMAFLLLGGVVVIGFILEGMRIAMTGRPEVAAYSVLGYAVSWLFTGMTRLTEIYGYVWYAHAVMTGLFVAYLPFSRMLHVILAPIVMAMNRIHEEERK